MNHNYYIYMVTNKTHSVLYTGVTNDVVRRWKRDKKDALINAINAEWRDLSSEL